MLLIWGDFKMKQSSPSTTKRISELKHILLTIAVLTLLGWLILLGWLLYLWLSQDFETAYQFVQHLSPNQMAYMTNSHTLYESNSPFLHDVQHDGFLLWILIQTASAVMFTKFVMLISAIPLFFLCVMAGLIDGLNQRAIRAACLGRESTYVFHKSVPVARKIMCLVLAIWLCVPMTLQPSPIFVSLGLMLGFVMRVSASRFKKYL